MPRVLPRPKFAPDDLVVPAEPFTGDTEDGAAFVCNPSDMPRRGDDPIVQRFPWFFIRQGDREALAAYHTAVYAQQAEERQQRRAEEAKRRAEEDKRVQALADKLEAEERKRRKQEEQATSEWWQQEAQRKRQRSQRPEKEAEEHRIRALAEAEVARRLAADEAA